MALLQEECLPEGLLAPQRSRREAARRSHRAPALPLGTGEGAVLKPGAASLLVLSCSCGVLTVPAFSLTPSSLPPQEHLRLPTAESNGEIRLPSPRQCAVLQAGRDR